MLIVILWIVSLTAVTTPCVYVLAKATTLGVLRGREIFAERQRSKETKP